MFKEVNMKKIIFALLLLSLVACNKTDDNSQGGQEWTNDTVPNPEDNLKIANSRKNNLDSSSQVSKQNSENTKPFKKEDISGEWFVNLNIVSTACEDKKLGEVLNQRWFVNFETGELNIKVMDRVSKVKEYWGNFTGRNVTAIADKKLTIEEMKNYIAKNTERSILNLKVIDNNLINGELEAFNKDLCKTVYKVSMKR